MGEHKYKSQALESLSSEAFLVVNKSLLMQYGPGKAIYISNLVDKCLYFKKTNMIQPDGSFFLTHEQQIKQCGLTLYEIRKYKKELKAVGIIKTYKKGLPAKEFYVLDADKLLDTVVNLKQPCPTENDRNGNTDYVGTIKETKVKENKKTNMSKMTRNKQKPKKTTEPVIPEQSSNLVKYIIPSQFDDFWKLYPRKENKIEARKKWKVVCNSPISDRPTWRIVKKAILLQKKSERWKDPDYIPLPTTWLNKGRWDADPSKMVAWGNNKSSSSNNKPKDLFKGKKADPVKILLEGIESKQSMDLPYQWHWHAPGLLNQAAKLCSCDNAGKLKLAKNFNTMYNEIVDERSPNGKHFKSPDDIIERFIMWLRDGRGDWVEDPKPHIFDITSTIFKNYFLPWLMTDNLDYNPITGKMDDTGCPYASR